MNVLDEILARLEANETKQNRILELIERRTQPDADTFLDIGQLAELLGTTKGAAKAMAQRTELGSLAVRFGTRTRKWKRSTVLSWIENRDAARRGERRLKAVGR